MRLSTILLACFVLAGLYVPSASANYCEDPEMPSHEIECQDAHEAQAAKAAKHPSSRLSVEAQWAIGGATAVGLAGAAFALRSLWWPPLRYAAGGFFARLTRRDVTGHPLRARILAAVGQNPGISATELAGQERINAGTLDYHLGILVRDGQLRATKAGRNRLLFLPGASADVNALAELSAPGRGDVARTILQEPGLHEAAIADRLHLSRATIHHHLSRLEAAGLVRVERGVRARCYPTDRLPQVLAPARPRRIAVLFDPNAPRVRPTD